jgi:SusD/RagB-like outer membrane lipoprotein
MMKNIKIYILSLMALFVSISCDKQLDINTDPLAATTADANVVLPYVIVQYSNRHVTELGTRTLDVSQHMAVNFNSPRNGSTSIFLTGNTWNMMYTQVLGNLLLVKQDAFDAGPGSNNVQAIAKILEAMVFYELSSIWEDVPFSEALNGAEFPAPNFDSQEDIFNGVLDILDEAVVLIGAIPSEEVFDVSAGDLIYRGDMDKWERFANSLKLRVLMLLRNGDGGTTYDAEINTTLNRPLIVDNDQAAIIRYSTAAGNINGFQALQEAFLGPSNEGSGTYSPGEHVYDLLRNVDPRDRLLIFDPNNIKPVNGAPTLFRPMARITDNVIRRDLPHMLFLPAEVSFYRAELALKGVTSGNAQAEFDTGLTQILEWWGGDIPGAQLTLTGTEISTFIGGLPPVTLTMVHEQQYLETFMRPIVAWNHVRRTNVPVLLPPAASQIPTILKRFNYAPAEVAANPKTPANPDTFIPMWFENL